jgi:beta-aspartyl-dipeptidase (metallo-type)
MLSLIRGGSVFAPEPLGERDVLLAGGRIAAIVEPGRLAIAGVKVDELDAQECSVVPGLVDSHVHLVGGGGEGGPATRAPELRIEDALAAGVTTVVGCLGTDGVTRHMSSLVAKARGLAAEGLSAFVFSGSYEVPVNTLTGCVRSDLILINEVVGAGEIAVSDHRSSQPTFDEIARLAAECRVGGMLGGKAGILHLHVGDGRRRLDLLFRLVGETEIPISQVVPTHCNRNPELLEHAIEWALAGGTIDLTAGLGTHGKGRDVPIADAVRRCRERGVPLERVTVSSDGNGSIPLFDAAGVLVGLGVASPRELWDAFRGLVHSGVLDLSEACRVFAANPARVYKLSGKGRIEAGADADLLVLGPDLALRDAFARGRRAVADGAATLRSTFARQEGR